jgi:hypothetical protein
VLLVGSVPRHYVVALGALVLPLQLEVVEDGAEEVLLRLPVTDAVLGQVPAAEQVLLDSVRAAAA